MADSSNQLSTTVALNLPPEVINGLINYLATRPYSEVGSLMPILNLAVADLNKRLTAAQAAANASTGATTEAGATDGSTAS